MMMMMMNRWNEFSEFFISVLWHSIMFLESHCESDDDDDDDGGCSICFWMSIRVVIINVPFVCDSFDCHHHRWSVRPDFFFRNENLSLKFSTKTNRIENFSNRSKHLYLASKWTGPYDWFFFGPLWTCWENAKDQKKKKI